MHNILHKEASQETKVKSPTLSSRDNLSLADESLVGLLWHSTSVTLNYGPNVEFWHVQPDRLPSISKTKFPRSGYDLNFDERFTLQCSALNNLQNYSSRSTYEICLQNRLYTPANQYGTMGLYLKTPLELVPFEAGEPGRKLNPFDTWPVFENARIDLEHLKYNCECASNLSNSHLLTNEQAQYDLVVKPWPILGCRRCSKLGMLSTARFAYRLHIMI